MRWSRRSLSLNLGARHRRILRAGLAVLVVTGLVMAVVARVRSEREKSAARPEVCEVVGELYRAALDGPVAPETDDEWTANTREMAARLSELDDPFGMSTKASTLVGQADGRRPTQIRHTAHDVGCPTSTFPSVPKAVFDSTLPSWAVPISASVGQPAVAHLPGAHLPPDSAVAENIRGATFATLVEAGVPVDKMPLLDSSQGRIAWIHSADYRDEQETTIWFVTKIDHASVAVARLMEVAAALPEMNAPRSLEVSESGGHITSADLSIRIDVSLEYDDDGTAFIEIARRWTATHGVSTPAALLQTLSYAAGPLTGSHSTLEGWWLKLGKEPELLKDPKEWAELDVRALALTIEQAVEPVMNSVADSLGILKADGSHLFRSRLDDPAQPGLDWRFVTRGSGGTRLFVYRSGAEG